MKNVMKLLSVFMIMIGSFAFGQTKAQEDLKQAGMQSLVEVSRSFYDENQENFIMNLERNDEAKLTPYERSLMLEVHENIQNDKEFGSYKTDVISQYKDYDGDAVAEKGKKKIIKKIIKVVIQALLELCEWLC